jgi:hypothetical protein
MLFECRMKTRAPRLVENGTTEVSAPALTLLIPLLLQLMILQSEGEQGGRESQPWHEREGPLEG